MSIQSGAWRRYVAVLCLGLATLASGASAVRAESVLRLVPQADLKILDPFFTTANITSNHGYMIYDVLFALDGTLTPKPEMVDTYSVSADNLVWSFKLRDGLKFSDGSPVEAKDAVASIKRLGGPHPGRPDDGAVHRPDRRDRPDRASRSS